VALRDEVIDEQRHLVDAWAKKLRDLGHQLVAIQKCG
jgi:hypothetical protein